MSHKITQFIEKNFTTTQNNQSSLLILNHSNSSSTSNFDSISNGSGSNFSTPYNESTTINQSYNNNNTSKSQQQMKHSHSYSLLNHQNNSKATPYSNQNLYVTPTHNQMTPNSTYSLDILQNNDDTCTITSALKHYLIHLKEPLMTFKFNQQFLDACLRSKDNPNDTDSVCQKFCELHTLVHQLPEQNFELLQLLMRHLNKVSRHSAQNKMTTSNLATCFGPTIFRAEQECVSYLYNLKFYSEIVEWMILYHEDFFQKNLDSNFLKKLSQNQMPTSHKNASNNIMHNLTPLPPTSNHTSTVNSLSKVKNSLSSTLKRGMHISAPYEMTYKNALMNINNIHNNNVKSSSVNSSSDSSSHEILHINTTGTSTCTSQTNTPTSPQLNCTNKSINNHNQNCISSPLSTSSPSEQLNHSNSINCSNNNYSQRLANITNLSADGYQSPLIINGLFDNSIQNNGLSSTSNNISNSGCNNGTSVGVHNKLNTKKSSSISNQNNRPMTPDLPSTVVNSINNNGPLNITS